VLISWIVPLARLQLAGGCFFSDIATTTGFQDVLEASVACKPWYDQNIPNKK
jgi:hypothetical protein